MNYDFSPQQVEVRKKGKKSVVQVERSHFWSHQESPLAASLFFRMDGERERWMKVETFFALLLSPLFVVVGGGGGTKRQQWDVCVFACACLVLKLLSGKEEEEEEEKEEKD